MSEWISVKDRLPEENEMVLVGTNKLVTPAYYNPKHHHWFSAINGYHLNNPTHWMPLPKAPKEE